MKYASSVDSRPPSHVRQGALVRRARHHQMGLTACCTQSSFAARAQARWPMSCAATHIDPPQCPYPCVAALQYMEALVACRDANPYHKFFGACNEHTFDLSKCLKEEKKVARAPRQVLRWGTHAPAVCMHACMMCACMHMHMRASAAWCEGALTECSRSCSMQPGKGTKPFGAPPVASGEGGRALPCLALLT